MPSSFIKAISYYLPEQYLTNETLINEFPEWSVKKIAKKIGVNKRHISNDNETSLDLGYCASLNLFKDHAIRPSDIDFILFCTQSPDYFLPTTACILQEKLGIPTTAGALDFNLGCSGYIYGLALAKGLISASIAKNILLITSETYTKRIHPKDKGNRTIFGDAAAATLISTEGSAKIGEFSLGTDGKGANNLILKSGGFRHPKRFNDLIIDENGNPNSSDYLYMNGTEIFNFTLESVPKLVDQTLQINNLSKENIDLFVFHQANKYMMEFIKAKIQINDSKFFLCMEEFGNTVSSTVPIALFEAKKQNKLKGNVMLAGFGVGYSWGGVVLTYNNY